MTVTRDGGRESASSGLGTSMHHAHSNWPELDYASWRETLIALQLRTQIVGKIRLALTPWLNHSWQVPLYVTARGLGTSPIAAGNESFDIEFDFVAHHLVVRTSGGESRELALEPQAIADFRENLFATLRALEISVTINDLPSELPDPIPFSTDRIHRAYDRSAVRAFGRVLSRADRIFKRFRTGFLGKTSPVHFFWGGFDLAVTRFSGRRAPPHPGGMPGLPDAVAREAYSHEVSSAGFWPGNDMFPRPAFYSYAYPEPPGFRDRPVSSGGYFDAQLGEFILPYDKVREAPEPETAIMDFLQATYAAAADSAHWDRAGLECDIGRPGVVRPINT
jgi:hypothetical protein